MKKQTIWIIIGCAISGAILYPIQRRQRMKDKAETPTRTSYERNS